MPAKNMALSLVASAVATTWLGAVGVRSVWARMAADRSPGSPVHLGALSDVLETEPRLWRGPTPPPAGYGELAARGVGLIVDLRSEALVATVRTRVNAAGMTLLSLPTPNAGVPDASHVDDLAEHHHGHGGITYVHCEAGEGRTGALIGAYQTRRGRSILPVISEQLAVGSLTIAQMTYVAAKGRCPRACVAIDRGIDRPTEKLFDLLR